MARLWTSSFINSVTSGVEWLTYTGTVSTTTTNARTSRSFRANPTVGTGFAIQEIAGALKNRGGWLRAYVYLTATPAANKTLIYFANGSSVLTGGITFGGSTTNPVLQLINSSGTQIGSSSQVLSFGVWYRVELGIDSSANPGTLEARLEGLTFASGANNIQGSWRRVGVGPNTNTTCDILIDDVAVNDDIGVSQNSWPGEGFVVVSRPAAAGDANTWLQTGGGAAGPTNYQMVDENPPNDATDLVTTVTNGNSDLYGVTDLTGTIPTGAQINVVDVTARHANLVGADATTAFKMQIEKASGGTKTQSAAVIPNSTTWVTGLLSTRTLPLITLYNDPDGNPWTLPTTISTQIGPILTAANVQAIAVTAVWMNIDYSTPTATGELPLLGVG